MALSADAQAAKAKLDADLTQGSPGINVKLGAALYAEMLANGDLPTLYFQAIGFRHHFPHVSYQRNFAFIGPELDPYAFVLGDGGHVFL